MDNTVQEARRYLSNAKEILREKAGKEDGFYNDRKYVKLAGHAAYNDVLIALDGLFEHKTKKRKDVDWYKARLAQVDKKTLNSFNAADELLHLYMGYDGTLATEVSQTGLKMAEYNQLGGNAYGGGITDF